MPKQTIITAIACIVGLLIGTMLRHYDEHKTFKESSKEFLRGFIMIVITVLVFEYFSSIH